MKIEKQRFFGEYRSFFGNLSQKQVGGLDQLLDAIRADESVTDLRHLAYMLATIKVECDNTWLPIKEYGGEKYFRRYAASTAKGKELGNIYPKDHALFPGQGYVMITGRGNYDRLGKRIGIDLISHPEKPKNQKPHLKLWLSGC